MNGKYIFIGIFAVAFLTSCEVQEDVIIKMDKEKFENERAVWNKQNLTNYQFTYDFFNDAGPVGPIKISIEENEVPVIENSNPYNKHIIAKNIPEIYDFISGTIDFIESVKNGTYTGHKIRSVSLSITYDNQYHYPKKVNLSTGYVESIDGGAYYTLTITEFTELNQK
jgi:hypothetical protein